MILGSYVRGREQSELALRAKCTRRAVCHPLVRINVEGRTTHYGARIGKGLFSYRCEKIGTICLYNDVPQSKYVNGVS